MPRSALVPVVVAGLALSIGSGAAAQVPNQPRITSPPAISGQPRIDAVLTATPGAWEPPGARPAYQWFRCPPGVTPSANACRTSSPILDRPEPYRVTAADQEQTLAIRLTVTLGDRSDSAFSAPTARVPRPPSNAKPPEVDGTAREGQVLTASPGEWLGTSPLTFTYRWERCGRSGVGCHPIANGQRYTAGAADVGMTLRVGVIAQNEGGTSAPAYSVLTGVIAPRRLISLEPPAITGTAEVGRALRATPGRWNEVGPIDFGYRWMRCGADGRTCAPIAAATAATYEVQAFDVGFRLRVRVTAISDSGTSASESALTALVPAPPVASPVPARPMPMRPFPRVRIRGYYTSTGAVLDLVVVRGARGALIAMSCRGAGCPFGHRKRRAVSRRVRLRTLERAFPARTRIELRITRPMRIGKYTKIVIRAGQPPARRDRCLMPDSPRPVDCRTF
jgi:hypothetical protein